MKQIVVLLTLFLTLGMSSGCMTGVPDNQIHAVKGEKGAWVYDSASKQNVQQIDSFYMLQPTWSQAIDYANQRPDNKYHVIAGVVLLLLFIIIGIGIFRGAAWLPNWSALRGGLMMFILLAGGIIFIGGNAYGVRWNNDKWVRKEVYEQVVKDSGSTKPIWDSLVNNHLIVDGPYIK